MKKLSSRGNFRIYTLVVLTAMAIGLSSVLAAESGGGKLVWQEIVAKAKTEGKVIVLGPPDADVRNSLTENFNKAFRREGITLEYQAGNLSSMGPKLDAELAQGRMSLDVGVTGTSLNIKHLLDALPQRLILPEVTDLAKWKEKKFKWVDGEKQCCIQTSEWTFGYLLLNTSQLQPTAINSWKDLLKPEYKGKIAFHDPTSPGAGQEIASYLLVKLGADYVSRLFRDQDVTTTRNYEQVAEWIARGKYPIGLAVVARHIEKFKQEGFPLKTLSLPDAPGTKSGGFSSIVLIKGAPHPNAATVFINWVLTKEGQEALLRPQLYPSRRTDTPTDYVPDYTLPKPGVEYLDTYTQDWHENRRKVQDEVIKAIGR